MGIFGSRPNDAPVAHRSRQMPMAFRRARLYFASWWFNADLRSVSAAESDSWWWDHSCCLSRRWQLFRECLHQNFRSLCTDSRLQNCCVEPYRCYWYDPSYIAQNFHLRWVTSAHVQLSKLLSTRGTNGTILEKKNKLRVCALLPSFARSTLCEWH